MLVLLSFITVNAQEKTELKAGDQSPVFKYVDINGKEVSLNDLKGKYVYIDVWATWCGPCKGELPLERVGEKDAREKDRVREYLLRQGQGRLGKNGERKGIRWSSIA